MKYILLGITLSALNVKRQSDTDLLLLLLLCTTQRHGSGEGAGTYLKKKEIIQLRQRKVQAVWLYHT
jgi:hypothetical protein